MKDASIFLCLYDESEVAVTLAESIVVRVCYGSNNATSYRVLKGVGAMIHDYSFFREILFNDSVYPNFKSR